MQNYTGAAQPTQPQLPTHSSPTHPPHTYTPASMARPNLGAVQPHHQPTHTGTPQPLLSYTRDPSSATLAQRDPPIPARRSPPSHPPLLHRDGTFPLTYLHAKELLEPVL